MRPEKRSYHQFCGIAKALDLVGDRWTLLMVRNLLLGPQRFSDFMADLPGITTNLLSKRLKELEAAGLILQVRLPPPGVVRAYQLSEAGAALEPVLMALGQWGWRWMSVPEPGDKLHPGWALLALKRRYHPTGERWKVVFQVMGMVHQIYSDGRSVGVQRNTDADATFAIRGSMASLRLLLYGNEQEALAAVAQLKSTGVSTDWPPFCRAFGLPNILEDQF